MICSSNPIFSKLYILSSVGKEIVVCHLNATSCTPLIDPITKKKHNATIFEDSNSLAVWPAKGYLYFCQATIEPFVGRFSMDGIN
jgi:hypothetical protein